MRPRSLRKWAIVIAGFIAGLNIYILTFVYEANK